MSSPAQYRSHAAECLAAARAREIHASKALFLLMADAWVRLADEVENGAWPNALPLTIPESLKANERSAV
jgi:hypothetical protein